MDAESCRNALPNPMTEGPSRSMQPVALEFRGGCSASSRDLVDCRKGFARKPD
jgi:hypothetical protein